MKLDKTIVRLANFIFGISSTSSIRSINFDTLLKSITFHIMPFNTLFLIYLANMDKLGVFFNNITNQVIQSQTYTQPAQSYLVVRKNDHSFLLWYISVYIISGQKEKHKIKNLGINIAY